MDKINLVEKFACFSDTWSPRIIAELNGQHVKIVRIEGAFVWHSHEHEDELFLVVEGRFCMEYRDRKQWVEKGELVVVPCGVEHRPVAEEHCQILLFEPKSTVNTGETGGQRTVDAIKL